MTYIIAIKPATNREPIVLRTANARETALALADAVAVYPGMAFALAWAPEGRKPRTLAGRGRWRAWMEQHVHGLGQLSRMTGTYRLIVNHLEGAIVEWTNRRTC